MSERILAGRRAFGNALLNSLRSTVQMSVEDLSNEGTEEDVSLIADKLESGVRRPTLTSPLTPPLQSAMRPRTGSKPPEKEGLKKTRFVSSSTDDSSTDGFSTDSNNEKFGSALRRSGGIPTHETETEEEVTSSDDDRELTIIPLLNSNNLRGSSANDFDDSNSNHATPLLSGTKGKGPMSIDDLSDSSTSSQPKSLNIPIQTPPQQHRLSGSHKSWEEELSFGSPKFLRDLCEKAHTLDRTDVITEHSGTFRKKSILRLF
jgi:hypothetical protein